MSISLYWKCGMSFRICCVRRDSRWASEHERAWFVLKHFAIVTVSEEQDSLFLQFCLWKPLCDITAYWSKSCFCRLLMLLWELHKQFYPKDCVLLWIISTLGEPVNSAKLSRGDSNRIFVRTTDSQHLNFLRLPWRMWSCRTTECRQQLGEQEFLLAKTCVSLVQRIRVWSLWWKW